MRTNGSRQVDHLQERLARLEKLFDKVKADVGALKQRSQIAGTMPGSSGGIASIYYGTLASGATIASAGTGSVTIAGLGSVTVNNVAGSVTGPANVIVGLMIDGSYSLLVAPCSG